MGELLVVYDTTVLRGRNHDLDHPTLVAIRKMREELGYRLAIPEVVVEESIRQRSAYLRKLANKGKDALNNLSVVSGIHPGDFYDDVAIEAAIANFPGQFKNRIHSEHDEILPIPEPTVEALFRRDLEQKRPFGGSQGKGLRDYLIWLSILNAKQKHGSRICFISANTNDFAVDGKLAPEYVEDLRKMGEPDQGVMLVKEPEDFIKEWIQPSEEEMNKVHGKYLEESYGRAARDSTMELLEFLLGRMNVGALLSYCTEDIDDVDWIIDGKPNLVVSIHYNTIERVVVMPSGERMIDLEIEWRTITEHDDRDRPDDPFDYYELAWSGKIRFILKESLDSASSMRFIETRLPDVDDVSAEGNWALEARQDRLEYEASVSHYG